MAELVLYGHPDSGHACKVALALSLAKLAHRTVLVDSCQGLLPRRAVPRQRRHGWKETLEHLPMLTGVVAGPH